jgi:hypothetical protein
VTVSNGAAARATIRMNRIMDLPRAGWWGGDVHVHMNYGGHYRNTPANLKRQAQAEGLQVVENLIVNKEQRIPDIAYWQPGVDSVSSRDFILAHAEEYHTSYWGHSALLGLTDYFVLPNYVGYANTAAASLWPMNADVFDIARSQGAIAGYVHPFDARPDPFDKKEAIRYEMPIDVALGKLDYFEVMGYSDHLITSEFWYRLLNCGFRIPAAAGTDAFPNFASLRGPPGLVRVYARLNGGLDHRPWLESLKAGRTFVTNSAILGLGWRTVAGPWRGIGDSVSLPAGEHAGRGADHDALERAPGSSRADQQRQGGRVDCPGRRSHQGRHDTHGDRLVQRVVRVANLVGQATVAGARPLSVREHQSFLCDGGQSAGQVEGGLGLLRHLDRPRPRGSREAHRVEHRRRKGRSDAKDRKGAAGLRVRWASGRADSGEVDLGGSRRLWGLITCRDPYSRTQITRLLWIAAASQYPRRKATWRV